MIIYMGVSGSGKGTQCEMLAKTLGYTHLTMSDLIRRCADQAMREKMAAGILLDDADAISIVSAALEGQKDVDKVILDGFPRTLAQARWLVDQVHSSKYAVDAIIRLELPIEEVRKRLLSRARLDDTPKVIDNRIEWYHAHTAPAIKYFEDQELPIYVIEGTGTPDEVYGRTLAQLKAAHIVS